MEKQMNDQESKELRAKRKALGLADFEQADDDQVVKAKSRGVKDKSGPVNPPKISAEEEPEPLSPFRRSGEPGSRK